MSKKTGSRTPIPPEITVKDDRDHTLVSRHPSFATVGFFATYGGSQDLFGANVKVTNTIKLVVSRAHMETGTVDRVYEDDTILELEMTEASFTQAITQFNRGTGTPATLRQGPDEDVRPVVYPQVVYPSVDERIKSKSDKRIETEMRNIRAALAEVSAISTAEGSVSKKSLQSAVRNLEALMSNLPGNLNYYRDQLREDTDTFLAEAKMELHASASLLLGEGRQSSVILEDKREDDADKA